MDSDPFANHATEDKKVDQKPAFVFEDLDDAFAGLGEPDQPKLIDKENEIDELLSDKPTSTQAKDDMSFLDELSGGTPTPEKKSKDKPVAFAELDELL